MFESRFVSRSNTYINHHKKNSTWSGFNDFCSRSNVLELHSFVFKNNLLLIQAQQLSCLFADEFQVYDAHQQTEIVDIQAIENEVERTRNNDFVGFVWFLFLCDL